MPCVIVVPEKELYDSSTNEFFTIPKTTLTLEHSLISISKWESKWHKPYLSKDPKTQEEALDYIRCMSISPIKDLRVLLALTEQNISDISVYVQDPMTATTINDRETKRPSREIITSEVVYYWMTALNIPFEPCEKWHFSRLMMLINVCAIKQQPSKKMPKLEAMNTRKSLNAQRRALLHSSG